MSPRAIDRASLAALREKYEAMLALRLDHDRAKRDPTFVEPDPRPAMAKLAARFPGALREIDDLPLDVIRARIEALAIAEGDDTSVARWMIAQDSFHRLARGALATKRWLGKTRSEAQYLSAAFATAIAEGTVLDDARVWASALDDVARPPRGRLMNVVFARASIDLGIAEAELRVLVFGEPRRRAR